MSASDDEPDVYDHADLTNRIKRTLYYDPLKRPDRDTLSYSATESAVTHFRDVVPMPIGKLGHRYASRLARDACISPCAMLLGLIYIERLKKKNPKYLETISSSELFLVSMMVSSKYLYDEGCEEEVFNDEWAVSGDTDVGKVNRLEREFLHAIDWRLYVHPREFSSALNGAESEIALSNGRKRGWLTYSDLMSLLDSRKIFDQFAQAFGTLSKATCCCMIVYSGLVCLTAVTSVALVTLSTKSLARSAGPDVNGRPIHLDGNATEEELDAKSMEVPSVAAPSVDLPERNRHRVSSISAPVGYHKNDEDVHMTHNGIANHNGITHDLDYDRLNIPIVKRDECPLTALMEAVFVMTHIPRLCSDYGETLPTGHCTNCEKTGRDTDNALDKFKYSIHDLETFYNSTIYSGLFLERKKPVRLKSDWYSKTLGIHSAGAPSLTSVTPQTTAAEAA